MPRAIDGDCRWTRARLPLLAGGDLIGPDRRQTERHLIGCPSCRERLTDLQRSLEQLHQTAAVSPASPNAPSIWPALARQLREERHPARWTFGWTRLQGQSWAWGLPASGLALAASMLVCVGLAGVVYHATTSPEPLGQLARLVRKPTPSTPMPAPTADPEPTTIASADIPSADDLKAADGPTLDTGGTR